MDCRQPTVTIAHPEINKHVCSTLQVQEACQLPTQEHSTLHREASVPSPETIHQLIATTLLPWQHI